jgi:RNA polymerase sigma-70 factor (ECF subfamily)
VSHPPLPSRPVTRREEDDTWLQSFHRGDRAALSRMYEDYVRTVAWAVRPIVEGVDLETVVHDVFCRLMGNEQARRSFSGGNFGAWLITIARRQAIDFRRRLQREELTDDPHLQALDGPPDSSDASDDLELGVLISRFRERVLPVKWQPVFQARFIEQLGQREAARRLGMRRTTLAYQELRIRALLRQFALEGNP